MGENKMKKISDEVLGELVVWASVSNEAMHAALIELTDFREKHKEAVEWVKGWKENNKTGFGRNSLRKMQKEQRKWSLENFGPKHGSGYRQLLGAMEELGELAHAHLKAEQGIRSHENHEAAKKDAIADIVIYLMGYCNDHKFDLQSLVASTWNEVKKRDWNKDPETAHLGNGA